MEYLALGMERSRRIAEKFGNRIGLRGRWAVSRDSWMIVPSM